VPEICHRVGIAAPRHRVYEEFATKDGLVEFCTPVEGDRELGRQIKLPLRWRHSRANGANLPQHRGFIASSGASLDDVESCLVHLANLADYGAFKVVYPGQFPGETKSVRTTVRADSVADIRVEVTAIANRAR
jgi:hypothetical protein